jgi:hypothetical protein
MALAAVACAGSDDDGLSVATSIPLQLPRVTTTTSGTEACVRSVSADLERLPDIAQAERDALVAVEAAAANLDPDEPVTRLSLLDVEDARAAVEQTTSTLSTLALVVCGVSGDHSFTTACAAVVVDHAADLPRQWERTRLTAELVDPDDYDLPSDFANAASFAVAMQYFGGMRSANASVLAQLATCGLGTR